MYYHITFNYLLSGNTFLPLKNIIYLLLVIIFFLISCIKDECLGVCLYRFRLMLIVVPMDLRDFKLIPKRQGTNRRSIVKYFDFLSEIKCFA